MSTFGSCYVEISKGERKEIFKGNFRCLWFFFNELMLHNATLIFELSLVSFLFMFGIILLSSFYFYCLAILLAEAS